jgi:putative pyruvate formate lyase activating enzyme
MACLASYNLHFGEEDPLVGEHGSGTIFFAGCNLGCVFCQNYDISHSTRGAPEATPEQLAGVMLHLQGQGAHNINFVTPTHVVPQILEALPLALSQGLSLPLVYNCGGYERLETLRLLDGVIDIYMPDAKFTDPDVAERFCQAGDYPQRAMEAMAEMHRQVGDLAMDEHGVAVQGLLVRHLLMPDDLAGSEDWFRFLAQSISPGTYLNVMDQYRPCGEASRFPELQGTISAAQLQAARELAAQSGLTRLDRRKGLNARAFFKLFGH